MSCKSLKMFLEVEVCFLSLFQNLVSHVWLNQSVQNLVNASYFAAP